MPYIRNYIGWHYPFTTLSTSSLSPRINPHRTLQSFCTGSHLAPVLFRRFRNAFIVNGTCTRTESDSLIRGTPFPGFSSTTISAVLIRIYSEASTMLWIKECFFAFSAASFLRAARNTPYNLNDSSDSPDDRCKNSSITSNSSQLNPFADILHIPLIISGGSSGTTCCQHCKQYVTQGHSH